MRSCVDLLRRNMTDEAGAEVVEWVLWVGGLAMLAAALYGIVSGTLTNTIGNIIGGVTGISSS